MNVSLVLLDPHPTSCYWLAELSLSSSYIQSEIHHLTPKRASSITTILGVAYTNETVGLFPLEEAQLLLAFYRRRRHRCLLLLVG